MIKDAEGKVLFTDDEIACPCCGKSRFADGFLNALLALRLNYKKPMTPNSCCRCVNHNKDIDGHKKSYHLIVDTVNSEGCCAIDIRNPPNNDDKHELVRIALNSGWSVGVYKTFMHLQYSPGKKVIFRGK